MSFWLYLEHDDGLQNPNKLNLYIAKIFSRMRVNGDVVRPREVRAF